MTNFVRFAEMISAQFYLLLRPDQILHQKWANAFSVRSGYLKCLCAHEKWFAINLKITLDETHTSGRRNVASIALCSVMPFTCNHGRDGSWSAFSWKLSSGLSHHCRRTFCIEPCSRTLSIESTKKKNENCLTFAYKNITVSDKNNINASKERIKWDFRRSENRLKLNCRWNKDERATEMSSTACWDEQGGWQTMSRIKALRVIYIERRGGRWRLNDEKKLWFLHNVICLCFLLA